MNLEDDQKIDACYIVARRPDEPHSEDIWMVENEEVAKARLEVLQEKYLQFKHWHLEICRIDLETWRRHLEAQNRSKTDNCE